MAVSFLIGCLYLSSLLLIFFFSYKRSSFWGVILAGEYFYLLGLGVFPILLSMGLVSPPEIFQSYTLNIDDFSFSTLFHVFLYSLGALLGYFSLNHSKSKIADKLLNYSRLININNYTWFYGVAIFSLFFSGIYIYLVGFSLSITNASLVRSGNVSGLAGFTQYLFLKKIAMVGTLLIIFLPFIIHDRKRVASSFLIILLVCGLIYLQTVSRGIIMEMVGVFLIPYVCIIKLSIKQCILLIPIVILLISTFLFGKVFVGLLSNYLFSTGDLVLSEHLQEDQLSYFFKHFAHILYSIDAGLKNSFQNGVILPTDIVLAPLGIFPSSFFTTLGLNDLSYQLVPIIDRLSCINSSIFYSNSENCTIPPYYIGFSAYILPFVGGVIFGYFRFFIYSIMEKCWIKSINHSSLFWLPYLILIILLQIMLFIPNTIAFAFFLIILCLSCLFLRKVLSALKN